MSCKSISPSTTYEKKAEENFKLRDWIKKEIVHSGTEIYHIDVGTSFAQGLPSTDTGALTSEDHLTREDLPMYYTGSVGYKNIVTYIGIHRCTTCNTCWWLELKKKKDLRIMDYVGPFQDSYTEFFDLEATVTAKIIETEIVNAFQKQSLTSYYLIASKTDFFDRFYDLHLKYFETIVNMESEQMMEFYNSESYKTIQGTFFIRSAWQEFIKRQARRKKKKK